MTVSEANQGIVTPEAVVLAFETAGVGSRILATLIDLAVQGVALVVAIAGFAVLSSTAVGLAGVFVSLFLILFAYPVVMEATWRGRTLGKAAMDLRVVTTEGGQIGFRHAAVRGALDFVDLWLTSGAAAILSVLLTPRNQRLGDLAAGTLVLRERSGQAPPVAVHFAVYPGWEGYAATLDVTGLTSADYHAARTFLLRAPSLDGASRERLAAQIATAVLPRLHHQPPAGVPAEAFLLCVVARYQQRQQGAWSPAAQAPGAPWAAGAGPESAADTVPTEERQPGGPRSLRGATAAPPGVESAPVGTPPEPGGFVAPG